MNELPPLPECDASTVGLGAVWNRHSMQAYAHAALAAQAQQSAVNAELLAACKTVAPYIELMKGRGHEFTLLIQAAIAKAEGGAA